MPEDTRHAFLLDVDLWSSCVTLWWADSLGSFDMYQCNPWRWRCCRPIVLGTGPQLRYDKFAHLVDGGRAAALRQFSSFGAGPGFLHRYEARFSSNVWPELEYYAFSSTMPVFLQFSLSAAIAALLCWGLAATLSHPMPRCMLYVEHLCISIKLSSDKCLLRKYKCKGSALLA